MGAATCAAVLQPLPIIHHFHGCTALLVLRFVVVKWRYIKYLALPLPFYIGYRFNGHNQAALILFLHLYNLSKTGHNFSCLPESEKLGSSHVSSI